MKEFLLENWELILTLAGVGFAGSLKVTRAVFKKVFIAGVHAFFTEDMIEKIIIKALEKYVKKTDTKLDDEWLEALKKELGK